MSLQCRRSFGKRTLSTSSRNLKAEEGWGEIDISTEGVVDRREKGGGGGECAMYVGLTVSTLKP